MPDGGPHTDRPLLAVSPCCCDGRLGIALDGELDLASAEWLRQSLRRVTACANTDVVIDTSRLRFCDVAGLGLLVEADNELRDRGQRLILDNLGPHLRRLLALAGLRHLFDPADRPSCRGPGSGGEA
jgi:anti-anti-sigma factor